MLQNAFAGYMETNLSLKFGGLQQVIEECLVSVLLIIMRCNSIESLM